MFADSKRQKYLPVPYRGAHLENRNKILNNNTSLRVFDRNNPANGEIKPHLDQNVAGIRPKEYFLSYDVDNPGIINQTKSRHYKTLNRN